MQQREIINNENKPHQKHLVAFITNNEEHLHNPKNPFIMLSGSENTLIDVLETKLQLKENGSTNVGHVYVVEQDLKEIKKALEVYENEHVIKCAMFPRKKIEPPTIPTKSTKSIMGSESAKSIAIVGGGKGGKSGKSRKATIVIDIKTEMTDEMMNILDKMGVKMIGTSASNIIGKLKVPRVDTNGSIYSLEEFRNMNIQITAHNVDEVARVAKFFNVTLLKFKHENPYFTGAGHFN